MTEPEALRIICEAAALDDSEAAALLRAHYDVLPYPSEYDRDNGKGELLLALAWLDPEDALARLEGMGDRGQFLEISLGHLREAHVLSRGDEEELTAYKAMTALLPSNSQQKQEQLQILRYTCDLCSLEDYLPYEGIEEENHNLFFIARLWYSHAELLCAGVISNMFSPFWVIGRFILSGELVPQNLHLLTKIYPFGKLLRQVEGTKASETDASSPVVELSLHVLKAMLELPGTFYLTDDIVAARVFSAAVLAAPNEAIIVNTLLRHMAVAGGAWQLTHQWVTRVSRIVSALSPDSQRIKDSLMTLRIVTLAEHVEKSLRDGVILREVRPKWRWLLRSQRIIDSVPDPEWRAMLHQRKQKLEAFIPQSKRKIHIMALGSYNYD